MTTTEVSFKNSAGHNLSGIIRYSEPVEPVKYPVIIILHGFAENKDADLIADLANNLVHYGFLTLRFDFHGHGDSDGLFEKHTIAQQVDDVLASLDFISTLQYADKDRIAVVGTDIGGNIAMLAAAKDARIKALIIQGARSHFEHHINSRFQPHEIREMMLKKIHDNVNFKISKDYLDSTREQDIIDELKRVHAPILFVHGNSDFRVKIEETRELVNGANDPKSIESVPGADHWFRGAARPVLLELIVSWARRWLR